MFIIHKNGDFEASKNPPCGCYGNYNLSSNNTKIEFGFEYPDTLIEPLGSRFPNIIWNIDRLTNDEIHLTANVNNKFIKWNLKE